MAKKIKVLLAQHNELFRKSLAELLKTQPELDITGDAGNGKELLEQAKTRDADIVLLDVDMPVMDGKATLEVLRLRFPYVKVIVLGDQQEGYQATEFMSRGARCYLTTGCSTETLFAAIATVSREGYYFDNSLSKAMLGALMHKRPGGEAAEVKFSDRETDIVRAVCDGKTNKEIARELHVSSSTIDFYKGRIYEKAKCNSAAGLIRYALKRGIVCV